MLQAEGKLWLNIRQSWDQPEPNDFLRKFFSFSFIVTSASSGYVNTMSINQTGFTVLHDPLNPELDIIFVHGLQGHPEKTWTFFGEPRASKPQRGFFSCFSAGGDSEDGQQAATPPVFWPRDLLRHNANCSKARIMTYGYDSFVLQIQQKALVNDTTISQHAESLIMDVARKRCETRSDENRPLMFIVHSLGGILVKNALNIAYLKRDNAQFQDLRAVLDSTFSIIFLGTPHRGSANYADFGRDVARVAALVTVTKYNDKVIRNLAPNNEILTNLRKAFGETYEYMVKNSHFESSTFQEGKGLTGVTGFRGKVVDDDSSELGHSRDRQQVLNRNHKDMCRFKSAGDSEYLKVEGEITRHIHRLRNLLQQPEQIEDSNTFMTNLQKFARFAILRKAGIAVRYAGTAEWIWTATATSEGGDGSMHVNADMKSWLAGNQDQNLFWITGRPGSGKSTIVKFLLDDERTKEYLSAGEGAEGSESTPEWYSIGLFITSRGTEQQRQWRPMLQGILYQLLYAQPALLPGVMAIAKKRQQRLGQSEGSEKTYSWSTSTIEEILIHCKSQVQHPIRALILFDGLDELQEPKDAEQAVSFLKSLATRQSPSSRTSFKVCFASRSENQFMNLFRGIPRVHVHEHTQVDIRSYTWDRLSRNPRFMHQNTVKTQDQLGPMMKLICDNAHGVFLWVYSVVSIADQSLADGETMEDVYKTVAALPTEMDELYRHILQRIHPRLRQKAYLMLETVLRSRQPPTLRELFLIVQVAESNLSGRPTPWTSGSLPDSEDFLDPDRMQSQLLASCRCFLEIVRPEGELLHGKYLNGDGTRAVDPTASTVQLLHRTAKDFLLFEGAEVLVGLWTPKIIHDTIATHINLKFRGNGHVYILQFIRAWWKLPESARGQPQRWDEMEEILYHAPLVEKTLPNDSAYFFPVLDDLDEQATVMRRHSSWPPVLKESSMQIPWKHTFPTFAVKEGMIRYVAYLIAEAKANGSVRTFLDRDGNRPLLHFALDSPQRPPDPKMVGLLLRSGASVTKRFGGKTAIEKLRFESMSKDIYEIYRLFLEHGSNPNSHWYRAGDLHFSCPLIHLAAYRNSNEDEQLDENVVSQRAIDLMKLLVAKGANIHQRDSDGNTLMTALFLNKRVLPLNEWLWLLKHGSRITEDVVHDWNQKTAASQNSEEHALEYGTAAEVLFHPIFRKREWYEDDAAKEAEKHWPKWFEEEPSNET